MHCLPYVHIVHIPYVHILLCTLKIGEAVHYVSVHIGEAVFRKLKGRAHRGVHYVHIGEAAFRKLLCTLKRA